MLIRYVVLVVVVRDASHDKSSHNWHKNEVEDVEEDGDERNHVWFDEKVKNVSNEYAYNITAN